MSGIGEVVPCDLVSYNVIDLVGGATQTFFEPVIVPRRDLEDVFARLIDQHPLIREYDRTRDPRPLRLSDHISLPKLRALDLYHEVFRPLETTHQLAFSVHIDANVVIGIGLNRSRTDFDDRDLAAMTALQPHLAAAYHHARLREQVRSGLAGRGEAGQRLAVLTPREREVTVLVAHGRTNRQIASTLHIAERTVDKHVANILDKLAVPSRVAVAAVFWDVPID